MLTLASHDGRAPSSQHDGVQRDLLNTHINERCTPIVEVHVSYRPRLSLNALQAGLWQKKFTYRQCGPRQGNGAPDGDAPVKTKNIPSNAHSLIKQMTEFDLEELYFVDGTGHACD